MVEHCLREAGAVSSNLATPTKILSSKNFTAICADTFATESDNRDGVAAICWPE